VGDPAGGARGLVRRLPLPARLRAAGEARALRGARLRGQPLPAAGERGAGLLGPAARRPHPLALRHGGPRAAPPGGAQRAGGAGLELRPLPPRRPDQLPHRLPGAGGGRARGGGEHRAGVEGAAGRGLPPRTRHRRRRERLLRRHPGGGARRAPLSLGLGGRGVRRFRLARGTPVRLPRRHGGRRAAARQPPVRRGGRLAAGAAQHPADGGDAPAHPPAAARGGGEGERRLPARRGRPGDPGAHPRGAAARPDVRHQRLPGAGDERRAGRRRHDDVRGGGGGLRGPQGPPGRGGGPDGPWSEARADAGRGRAPALPGAVLPHLPLPAARGADGGGAAPHPRPARHLHRLPVPRARPLLQRSPLAGADVGDELADGAAGRLGDVLRHALLRAAAVRGRHAAAVPDLALRGGRRPPDAQRDRALRRLAHPGGDHRQPLPVGTWGR
jgi:hypothetical protein